MNFNLIFEILIYFLILVVLICVILTVRKTFYLKQKASFKHSLIKLKLEKNIQKKLILDEKVVLTESTAFTMNAHIFSLVKKFLMLTKSLFKKSL